MRHYRDIQNSDNIEQMTLNDLLYRYHLQCPGGRLITGLIGLVFEVITTRMEGTGRQTDRKTTVASETN